MHLAFDILAGIGIAVAFGIRPFLGALVVGALAAGHVVIHFKGTDFSFLQSVPFLLGMVVGLFLLVLAERRFADRVDRGPGAIVLGAVEVVLAALFFAGSLARDHYTWWPGLIAGAICALIAMAASRPLFARVRDRLDPEAAGAVPIWAEAIAVVLAALSAIAPPFGIIALLAMIWLLVASRRREGQKYAGLRILR